MGKLRMGSVREICQQLKKIRKCLMVWVSQMQGNHQETIQGWGIVSAKQAWELLLHWWVDPNLEISLFLHDSLVLCLQNLKLFNYVEKTKSFDCNSMCDVCYVLKLCPIEGFCISCLWGDLWGLISTFLLWKWTIWKAKRGKLDRICAVVPVDCLLVAILITC